MTVQAHGPGSSGTHPIKATTRVSGAKPVVSTKDIKAAVVEAASEAETEQEKHQAKPSAAESDSSEGEAGPMLKTNETFADRVGLIASMSIGCALVGLFVAGHVGALVGFAIGALVGFRAGRSTSSSSSSS